MPKKSIKKKSENIVTPAPPVATPTTAPKKKPTPRKIVDAASKIRKLLHGANEQTVSRLYEVSELVRDTQKGKGYGAKAVELLAKELSDFTLSPKTLANYSAVSKNLPRKKFDELARRQGGTKERPFRLTWSHFLVFARLDGREARPIITTTFEKGLTAKQAEREWVIQNGKGRAKEGKTRNDVARKVRAITHDLQSLLNHQPRIDGALAEVEAKKSTGGALGDDLPKLTREFEKLAEFAARTHARCKALLAKFDLAELKGDQMAKVQNEDEPAVTH